MPTTADVERVLRGVALGVTRPRVAVLSAVHDHPHADTDSIIGAVREGLGEVCRQAVRHRAVRHQDVYDVPRALTAARAQCGALSRRGSIARYEARVCDNHHHHDVVCRSCGAIADVDSHQNEAARQEKDRRV